MDSCSWSGIASIYLSSGLTALFPNAAVVRLAIRDQKYQGFKDRIHAEFEIESGALSCRQLGINGLGVVFVLTHQRFEKSNPFLTLTCKLSVFICF